MSSQKNISTQFKIFYDALKLENLDCNNNKLIPQQYYAQNYSQFNEQIKNYMQKNNIHDFLILTDGTPKKSSLENNLDVIDEFKKFNLNIKFLNLAQICEVNSTEIHASEYYLQKLISILKEKNNSHFIALGSGTITDLLKHALHILNKNESHFISIPTATTVTAFTSAFSVVDIDGAKRTRPSRFIQATFWIEPLLKAAPVSLLKAGFGDLLARHVAYGDWFLGTQLNLFKHYDEIAFRLMNVYSDFLRMVPGLRRDDIVRRDDTVRGEDYLVDNINLFAQCLAMAGVSMSLCKATTPLSGYEHAISHSLDFLKISTHKTLVLHGDQVALGVLSSATSYDWLLDQETFNLKKLRSLSDSECLTLIQKLLRISQIFESQSIDPQICKIFTDDYIEKNILWNENKNNFQQFIAQWPDIKHQLKKYVVPAETIELILKNVDLPLFPEAFTPPTSAFEYRWALRFAPFVRSRFSLADFIFWIGEDPCALACM